MTYRPLDRFRELRLAVGFRRALWVGPLWFARASFDVLTADVARPLPPSSSAISVRWTSYRNDDSDALLALVPWLSAVEIVRRQQAGHECLIGWVGRILVYQRWYTTKPACLDYLGLVILPEHGDLISIDSYTHPRFRDQGVHTEALKRMLDWANARGLKRDVALVARWNHPSLRASIDKAGRVSIGSVERWRLGPWRRYRARGAATLDAAGRLRVSSVPDS